MLTGDNDEIPVWMAEADHCMINKALNALDAAADEEPLTICKVRAILKDIVEEWPECGDLRRHQLEMVPKSHIQLLWILGACHDPKTGAPRVAPDGYLVCAFEPGAWLDRQRAKAKAFWDYSPGDNNLDRKQRMKERNLSARMAGLQHLKRGAERDYDVNKLTSEREEHNREIENKIKHRERDEGLRKHVEATNDYHDDTEGIRRFPPWNNRKQLLSSSKRLENRSIDNLTKARQNLTNFEKQRVLRLRDNAKVIATHDIKDAVLKAVEKIHRQRAKINRIEKIALDAISRERDDKKINKYISYWVDNKNETEIQNKNIGSIIAQPIVTDIRKILEGYKTGILHSIQQDEVPSSRHRHPLVSTSQGEIELSRFSQSSHPPVSTSQRSPSIPLPPLPQSSHPPVSTSQRSHSIPLPPSPRSIHSTATPPEDRTPSPSPPFSREAGIPSAASSPRHPAVSAAPLGFDMIRMPPVTIQTRSSSRVGVRPVSLQPKHLSAIDPSSDAPLHLPIKAGRSKGPERYDIASQGDSPAGSVQSTYFPEWPSSPRQQPTAISEQPRRWNRRTFPPTSPLTSESPPPSTSSPFDYGIPASLLPPSTSTRPDFRSFPEKRETSPLRQFTGGEKEMGRGGRGGRDEGGQDWGVSHRQPTGGGRGDGEGKMWSGKGKGEREEARRAAAHRPATEVREVSPLRQSTEDRGVSPRRSTRIRPGDITPRFPLDQSDERSSSEEPGVSPHQQTEVFHAARQRQERSRRRDAAKKMQGRSQRKAKTQPKRVKGTAKERQTEAKTQQRNREVTEEHEVSSPSPGEWGVSPYRATEESHSQLPNLEVSPQARSAAPLNLPIPKRKLSPRQPSPLQSPTTSDHNVPAPPDSLVASPERSAAHSTDSERRLQEAFRQAALRPWPNSPISLRGGRVSYSPVSWLSSPRSDSSESFHSASSSPSSASQHSAVSTSPHSDSLLSVLKSTNELHSKIREALSKIRTLFIKDPTRYDRSIAKIVLRYQLDAKIMKDWPPVIFSREDEKDPRDVQMFKQMKAARKKKEAEEFLQHLQQVLADA